LIVECGAPSRGASRSLPHHDEPFCVIMNAAACKLNGVCKITADCMTRHLAWSTHQASGVHESF